MADFGPEVTALAQQLVRIDSRSAHSNLAVADCVEAALGGFAVETWKPGKQDVGSW